MTNDTTPAPIGADAILALLAAAPTTQEAPQQEAQEPCGWDGAEEWEKLAWHLCAEENGEDACNELIWEGGPMPEPWGDRWLKYEGEARRMIALVRTHMPATQPAPVAQGDALDVEIAALESSCAHLGRLIDELRPDAERYQYLRERDLDTIRQGGVFAGRTPDNVVLNGDDLDAAIDAARAQAKEGTSHG